MTQEEICQELMMADVIKIQLIPQTGTSMSVPFQIPNIATMGGTLASAIITLALTEDDGTDATFNQQGSSIKVSEQREQAGIIRTHALQAQIKKGFKTIRAKEAALQGKDLHAVFTTAGGQRYMSYGLPNTTQFSLDETMGQNGTLTLKLQLKSMSGLILLT